MLMRHKPLEMFLFVVLIIDALLMSLNQMHVAFNFLVSDVYDGGPTLTRRAVTLITRRS